VVNTTSFFIAYVAALAAAIMVLSFLGHASVVLVSASVLFIFLSAALVVGMLAFSGRDVLRGRPHWLLRYRVVQNAAGVMKDADLQIVHNVRLQLIASCLQLVTFLLDAATLWMLDQCRNDCRSLHRRAALSRSVRSAIQTVFIGGLAAAVAFMIARAIS
jgi:hypothetical protein